MKGWAYKYLLTVPVFLLAALAEVSAQLQVNNSPPNNNNPSWLVQNVLLGAGVTVSNVTYNGSPNAIGYFSNGQTTNPNLGLNSGMILASGNITNAIGPNTLGFAGNDNNFPGDPDLAMIVNPNQTYNAAILQFDFIPMADTVKFDFVFGSEEYPEYTCCSVNDVFGFFISGPGINGPFSNNSRNIALVPNTAVPIQINTLNGNCQTVSYCGGGCCGGYPQYYVDNSGGYANPPINPGPMAIQYDGFTRVLTAISPVQCGQQYHIKIAIADVGDGIFDSGVFLKEGSFTSTGAIIGTTSASGNILGNDSTMYEGCGCITVYIERGSTTTQDTVSIAVSGTATAGTDYSPVFPGMVILPVGVDSVGFTVCALDDNLTEGTDTIVLTFTQAGACLSSPPLSMNLYILDVPPFSVTPNNIGFCPGDSGLVSVNVTGGLPAYQYQWSNGLGTNPSVTVSPTATTTYTCTVTDTCGRTASVPVTVTVLKPVAGFTYIYVNGSMINFVNTSSPDAITFWWDLGNNTTSTNTNPSVFYPPVYYPDTGIYFVTLIVTNAYGCMDTILGVVYVLPDYSFWAPNAFTPNGDGINDIYYGYALGVKNYRMTIFNRWGEVIFESTDINTGWNGKVKGEMCQQEVYPVTFEVEFYDGKKIKQITHAALIR